MRRIFAYIRRLFIIVTYKLHSLLLTFHVKLLYRIVSLQCIKADVNVKQSNNMMLPLS